MQHFDIQKLEDGPNGPVFKPDLAPGSPGEGEDEVEGRDATPEVQPAA